jgi:5-methylcytosine-specific restriction enzyme A
MASRLRNLPPMVATVSARLTPSAPKLTDPHYHSPEHATWRKEVLRRAGYRCQARDCSHPRHGEGARLFADHVQELRDGGSAFDPANGQALCGACHTRKTIAARDRRNARPT